MARGMQNKRINIFCFLLHQRKQTFYGKSMKADEAQRAKISSLEAQVHRGDENLYEDKSKLEGLHQGFSLSTTTSVSN
jgi:hypothetical protein